MQHTPNVETVWLDDLSWNCLWSSEPLCWQHLQSLYIGDSAYIVGDPGMVSSTQLLPRFRTDNVRELHLESLSPWTAHYYCARDASSVPDKLEKFSIKTRIPLDKTQFERILRPSFTSKSIQELAVTPFPCVYDKLESEEMDWFKGDSLTCLSLTGLSLEAGRSIGSADDALISIVNRFPNLRCLEIDKEIIQPPTLAKIVSTTRVRTIYHLSGYLMEEVKDWAAEKYGAQIIQGYRPSPAQHPDRPLVSLRLAQSLRRSREN